jgi:NDP-sugar pyrophosphorylase family protein
MIGEPRTGPTLVALAAGVGSRFGGLKQLEAVGPGGETLLEYSVFDASRAGFARVVLVVRPGMEDAFRSRFDSGMARALPLEVVPQDAAELPIGFAPAPQRVKPWGTGHAVLAAEPALEGAFAVVNADDFYGAESFRELHRFLTTQRREAVPRFAMVGFEIGPTLSRSGPVSRALCRVDERGCLQGIVEIRELWKRGDGGFYLDADGVEVEVPADRRVSMNIWGFTPQVFAELGRRFREFLERQGSRPDAEFLVPDVIQDLVSEGKVRVEVLRGAGSWCGITYPEDLRRVTELLAAKVARGDYPADLWK